MERTFQVGDWNFEIVQLRARKTPEFGRPFSAVANITIANTEAHVEGLLSIEKITTTDYRTFDSVVDMLDCNKMIYRR